MATVCGITLCGGSAWPAGFAHAARAANPRATSASCTAGSATAVRVAHSRPSRRLWCDRSVRRSGCAHGLPRRDSAVEARGLRHAPIRAACGTVVSRVAVWGAVEGRACGRGVRVADTTCPLLLGEGACAVSDAAERGERHTSDRKPPRMPRSVPACWPAPAPLRCSSPRAGPDLPVPSRMQRQAGLCTAHRSGSSAAPVPDS